MIPRLSAAIVRCDEDHFDNIIMSENTNLLNQRGADALYSCRNGKNYDVFILLNTIPYKTELSSQDYEKILAELKRGTTIEEVCCMLNLFD